MLTRSRLGIQSLLLVAIALAPVVPGYGCVCPGWTSETGNFGTTLSGTATIYTDCNTEYPGGESMVAVLTLVYKYPGFDLLSCTGKDMYVSEDIECGPVMVQWHDMAKFVVSYTWDFHFTTKWTKGGDEYYSGYVRDELTYDCGEPDEFSCYAR